MKSSINNELSVSCLVLHDRTFSQNSHWRKSITFCSQQRFPFQTALVFVCVILGMRLRGIAISPGTVLRDSVRGIHRDKTKSCEPPLTTLKSFPQAYLCPSFSGGTNGKESTCYAGKLVRSLGWEDALEEGMATHSSILIWRISMDRNLVGCSTWGHMNWTRVSD